MVRKDGKRDGCRLVINGVGDGNFEGGRYITRAEFAAVVLRALGLPANGDGSVFSDVAETDWFYGTIGTAYNYGLVFGDGDGAFNPNAYITRNEAMMITRRAAAIMKFRGTVGDIDGFSDPGSIETWAHEAACWNVGSGLIVGDSGRIRGGDKITRAETATLVLRLLRYAGLIDVREEI